MYPVILIIHEFIVKGEVISIDFHRQFLNWYISSTERLMDYFQNSNTNYLTLKFIISFEFNKRG